MACFFLPIFQRFGLSLFPVFPSLSQSDFIVLSLR